MGKKDLWNDTTTTTDCDRPACDDMISKLQKAAKAAAIQTTKKVDCPLGSADLGRSSWGLLHSMAAWYPDRPSLEDKQAIVHFFSALARFYPCPWCAHDFRQQLNIAPVQAETRQELCQWLCQQHNLVNDKLGKPIFPCDMKSLDRRWKKNEEECQNDH